jgi:4-aminobutyrate aminotransferase/(S)-3-amino-2-methylpropionate transaminase
MILYNRLDALVAKYPNWIQNLCGRNKGTYIAFDTPNSSTLLRMREFGINIGSCGSKLFGCALY